MPKFLHSKFQMLVLGLVAATIVLTPVIGNIYYLHLITLITVYWVLISTLTLLVGYTGQISIGHAGLLAIGAYTYTILTGEYGVNPLLAFLASGGICAAAGLLLGLPSLRLPGFYFALATIAFALIVGENLLAWDDFTGGGTGLLVPTLPPPFDTPHALYWLSVGLAVLVSYFCYNLARTMWGRNMIAVRDSEIAALSVGIAPFRTKLVIFLFAGVFAGFSGALFALVQNYILPESFHFDLSLFFFISIIIGGRGELLGPFIGAVILIMLPEFMGSLAQYASLFYGVALLIVVLVVPRGLGPTLREFIFHTPRPGVDATDPDMAKLTSLLIEGKRP